MLESHIVHGLMYIGHELYEVFSYALDRHGELLEGIASHYGHHAVLNIPGAYLNTGGNALHLPLVELPARALLAVVQLYAKTRCLYLVIQLSRLLQNALFVHGDGQYDYLNGGYFGRQLEAAVIAVNHYHTADHAGRSAPGGGIAIFLLALAAQVLDIIAPCKVIRQVMGGAHLQRLAIMHQRFQSICGLCACKAFALALAAAYYGDRQHVYHKIIVYVEHTDGFFLRVLMGLMGGVPLLPKELGSAEEGAGALFPAHYVAPLVIQHGQVAIGLYPLGIHGADYRFAGGSDSHALLKHLVAALCYPCDLGREAFNVLRLFHQHAFGNQQREVCILMTCILEALIHFLLHELPYGIAIGLNGHTAANIGIVAHIVFEYDIGIPLRKIHVAGGNLLNELVFFLCHNFLRYY